MKTKEKAAPARAATSKNIHWLDNTTKLQKTQGDASAVTLCAACGLPIVGEMYELADGRQLHYSDDCLQKAAGIYVSFSSRYTIEEQKANAAAWYAVNSDSREAI